MEMTQLNLWVPKSTADEFRRRAAEQDLKPPQYLTQLMYGRKLDDIETRLDRIEESFGKLEELLALPEVRQMLG